MRVNAVGAHQSANLLKTNEINFHKSDHIKSKILKQTYLFIIIFSSFKVVMIFTAHYISFRDISFEIGEMDCHYLFYS